MPSHKHTGLTWETNNPITLGAAQGSGSYYGATYVSNSNNSANGIRTNNTGGTQPHNNMPPYLVVYMWKRVS